MSSMHENNFVVKVDSLLEQEMKSLQLLFERHHFQNIALYKEIPELADVFDPKTVTVRPKLVSKNSQFSMSQKSFSRYSNGAKITKSPKSEQKKVKTPRSHENIPIFCKVLVTQLSQSTTLESLKIFGLKLSRQSLNYLASGIKQNQSLKELYITYCDLTSHDFERIFGAIGENNHLNLVDLSHNQLDDDAGRMIGSIIGVHGRKRDEIMWVYSIRGDQPDEDPELKGICDLNLSYNQLGSRALRDMCGPLRHDTWLRNLNLRGNQIGEDGIYDLKEILENNNSIFAIDLRENPFFNPGLSKEIVNKLATNIYNYKEKNMLVTDEENDQMYNNDMHTGEFNYSGQQSSDHQGQTFPGWNSRKGSNTFDGGHHIERIESDKTPNKIVNEDIEELMKQYDAKSPIEEEENKEDGFGAKLEAVSFGFRNEKIQENLRKNYKKSRLKHTKSEGRSNMFLEKGNLGGEGDCLNCKQLGKKLLLSESRGVNLLLENYKLKKKLNAILQAQNSWSAISPQLNEMENTSNAIGPHPESISHDLFKKNTTTLGEQMVPESDEMFNRIENLMAELTRMMDNLENVNATNNFTGHFTNSTHLTNNNTYQLINSANNINFNSTYTNILNSQNNSRVNAFHNTNLQQTLSMHQIGNRDASKSFSRSHQPKNVQNLHNYSEQNALTPNDKSDNQESKAISQFSLFFQNENSHMNNSHS